MSADARVMQVADAVCAALAARLPAATVRVSFAPSYDRKTMSGAYVWVLPLAEREAAKLSRGSDQMGPKCAIIYAEKCSDRIDPDDPEPVADEWVRQRIKTVEAEVWDFLRQERTDVETPPIAGTWPETAEWVTVYDIALLSEDRVFWSEIEVEIAFPVTY